MSFKDYLIKSLDELTTTDIKKEVVVILKRWINDVYKEWEEEKEKV